MYETKIHDINNLRKCLIETWLDFDQDTSLTLQLTSGFIIWDHVCRLVMETLNTCSFIWFTRMFY